MNVSPALPQFVEASATGLSGNSGPASAFGGVFEQAIRDAAADSSPKGKPNAKGSQAHASGEGEAKSAGGEGAAPRRASATDAAAAKSVASHDEAVAALVGEGKSAGKPQGSHKTRGDAKTPEDGKNAPDDGDPDAAAAIDLLAQLISPSEPPRARGAATLETKTDAAGDGDDSPQLSERLVITPLSLKATAKPEASDPASARGNVKLEILHMETHFEPNADDFVLVEGTASGKVAGKPKPSANSAEPAAEPTVKLSFDEALARLTEQQGAAAGGSTTQDDGSGDQHGTRGERSTARSSDTRFTPSVTATGLAAADDMRAAGAAPTPDLLPTGDGIASMTSQVASRVIDALSSPGSGERSADVATGETHIRMKAGGAALKTLTIQLQPENLGTLEVSMRLVDGQLTLELAASQSNTAKVLSEDRAGLKKLLEHAGFSVDEGSISIIMRDPSASAQRATGSGSGDGGASGQTANQSGSQPGGQGTGQGSGPGGRTGGERPEGPAVKVLSGDATDTPTPLAATTGRSRNVYL